MFPKKHILFISSWYPNKTNITHGIFNKEFAKSVSLINIVSVLHVVSVHDLKKDYEIDEFIEDNILHVIIYYKKIKKEGVLGVYKKYKTTSKLYKLGYNIIETKNGQPNLIQLNVVMPAGVGVKYLSAKYKIPFVINEGWSGYMKEDGSYKGFFMKMFTTKLFKAAKFVMPVSESLLQAMQKHNLKANYKIIPNIVNTTSFLRSSNKQYTHEIKFLHISTLDDKQKNVSGIIKAFAYIEKTKPNARLTIIGSEKNSKELKDLAKKINVFDKITFKGVLTPSEINLEYNSHSVLVMFSNYETFCLVVAEALLCKLPVITSDCGGLTSSLPNNFCYKVPSGNIEMLAEAMTLFCNNKIIIDIEAAKQHIEVSFNPKIISEQLNQVYNTALQND